MPKVINTHRYTFPFNKENFYIKRLKELEEKFGVDWVTKIFSVPPKKNSANFNFAQEAMKKHYNLDPEDFVWAADLQLAWKTANDKIGPFNDGKRLILIYDKRLLENVEYGGYVFKLKKGISSFKQALAAVVIIDFR